MIEFNLLWSLIENVIELTKSSYLLSWLLIIFIVDQSIIWGDLAVRFDNWIWKSEVWGWGVILMKKTLPESIANEKLENNFQIFDILLMFNIRVFHSFVCSCMVQ